MIWLEGCGAGILLTLGLTWNNLSSWHIDLYQRQLPINTVVRAIAVDLVLISLGCVALLWLLERVDRRGSSLLWALLGSALIARALGGLAAVEVLDRKGVTPLRAFVVVLVLWSLLWVFARKWYPGAVRGFRFFLLLVGFCIFWILPQLVWLGFAKQPHDLVSFAKPVASQPRPHRRVVWLLFDEMSYDQLFDHRWPGLSMPNFDRLRVQSVNFSDVQPDGFFTRIVVPSLLTGEPVANIRSSTAGYLYLRESGGSHWRHFNPNVTLFADAHRQGWTTGIVAWYLPQCRLMPDQLDRCWMQLVPYGDHLSQQRSTLGNAVVPIRAAFARLRGHPLHDSEAPDKAIGSLVDASRSLIADDDIDFVLIHLPVPHPRGIYHRSTGKIEYGGSYIDNMALAANILGELNATLAKTPSASMTTLIVSSDHSWRVPLWRNKTGWTQEDEAASKGRFDPRPMLMVHFPSQTTSEVFSSPFPIIREHNLVDSLLHGPMTPAGLENWAARR